MPRALCRDHICTVAEVWCCSEHYLWLFDCGFTLEAYTAMYCFRVVFSGPPSLYMTHLPGSGGSGLCRLSFSFHLSSHRSFTPLSSLPLEDQVRCTLKPMSNLLHCHCSSSSSSSSSPLPVSPRQSAKDTFSPHFTRPRSRGLTPSSALPSEDSCHLVLICILALSSLFLSPT